MKRSHSGSTLDHGQRAVGPSHHRRVDVNDTVAPDAAADAPLVCENQQQLNTSSPRLTLTSTDSGRGSGVNIDNISQTQTNQKSPTTPLTFAPDVDVVILPDGSTSVSDRELKIDTVNDNDNNIADIDDIDHNCDRPLTIRGTCSQVLDGDYSAGPPLRYDRKCWGFAYMRKRGKKRPGRTLVQRNHQADCAAGPLHDSDTEDGESSSHQPHIRGWEGCDDSDPESDSDW